MKDRPDISRFYNDNGNLDQQKMLDVVPYDLIDFFISGPMLCELITSGSTSVQITTDKIEGFETSQQFWNRLYQVKRAWQGVVQIVVNRFSDNKAIIVFQAIPHQTAIS